MTDKPEPILTPQEAAQSARNLLPKVHNAGLHAVYVCKNKAVISFNAMDVATLYGSLSGIAEGRISCGDAKIHGCIAGMMRSLNAAAQESAKSTPTDQVAGPAEPVADVKPRPPRTEIDAIAKNLMSALFTVTRYGLTHDKVPLPEMVAERGIGFSDSVQPGPTGRFVSRIR